MKSPTDDKNSDITTPQTELVWYQCKTDKGPRLYSFRRFGKTAAAKSTRYGEALPFLLGDWSCGFQISLIFGLFCRFLLTAFFFLIRVISRFLSRLQQPTNIIIFLCKNKHEMLQLRHVPNGISEWTSHCNFYNNNFKCYLTENSYEIHICGFQFPLNMGKRNMIYDCNVTCC